jgi:hypothetical protein
MSQADFAVNFFIAPFALLDPPGWCGPADPR